ncbi:MAG: bifunctional DNA-formamidopyrimidine glycosylase/DNA-(apurinic or apyrimidinic site) lyase, partial [Calditrichaeota bacterium]
LITLSDNLTLWVHLKMTGHFFYKKKTEPVEKHDLVIFNFKNNGTKHLRFNDYRRFGRLRLYKTDEVMEQKGLVELGPEPLTLDVEEFVSICKRTSRMIKSALLDQSFIVGVGNIYADESLYASKIHPKKLTSSISHKKLRELHGHIQGILNLAIDNMGSSVDTYTGINGKAGTYQAYLKAYKREGEPCERCKRKIVRLKIGSRSAHFCPACQKEKS